MDETCIITIGGDLGSGKSTVARMLAETLGIARYSTGDLQRRMATGMGLTSLELNKLAEIDPDIDRKIDGSTVGIAAEEPKVVFDSRLAWHFVPNAFKVYLTVDPMVGATRIMNAGRGRVEEYESLEEALARVTERRASEDKRFGEIYGINMNRLANYHMVVDTTYADAETVKASLVEHLNNWLQGIPYGSPHPVALLNGRTPFPAFADQGEGVLRVGRHYFALDETAWNTALKTTTQLFPFPIQATDEEPFRDGVTARQYVEATSDPVAVHDFETTHNFTYPSYPTHFTTAA